MRRIVQRVGVVHLPLQLMIYLEMIPDVVKKRTEEERRTWTDQESAAPEEGKEAVKIGIGIAVVRGAEVRGRVNRRVWREEVVRIRITPEAERNEKTGKEVVRIESVREAGKSVRIGSGREVVRKERRGAGRREKIVVGRNERKEAARSVKTEVVKSGRREVARIARIVKEIGAERKERIVKGIEAIRVEMTVVRIERGIRVVMIERGIEAARV